MDIHEFNVGIEPNNSFDLFENSIPTHNPNVRLAIDHNGDIHRFFSDGSNDTGNFFWSGRTGDQSSLNHLNLNKFYQEIKQLKGKKK